jgi:hypothetical protein
VSEFCSDFDAALARGGPPAVFLRDREGLLRFDAQWTRDTWGRCESAPRFGWTWVVARDRASGFVFLVLATSPDLLATHPRLDVRPFEDRARAEAALEAGW